MKKLTLIGLMFVFLLSACGPKPQYKTAKGKKKNKYYNRLQYKKAWNNP